jgi:hypothetical protein
MRSLGKVQVAQAAVVDEDTKKAVGPLPRIDELYAWFKRNEVEDVATVVHGDFKIDNMVRINGAVDFLLFYILIFYFTRSFTLPNPV